MYCVVKNYGRDVVLCSSSREEMKTALDFKKTPTVTEINYLDDMLASSNNSITLPNGDFVIKAKLIGSVNENRQFILDERFTEITKRKLSQAIDKKLCLSPYQNYSNRNDLDELKIYHARKVLNIDNGLKSDSDLKSNKHFIIFPLKNVVSYNEYGLPTINFDKLNQITRKSNQKNTRIYAVENGTIRCFSGVFEAARSTNTAESEINTMANRGGDALINDEHPTGIVFIDANIIETYDENDELSVNYEKCYKIFETKLQKALEKKEAIKYGQIHF